MQKETKSTEKTIPTQSKSLWITLGLSLVVILALTMLKDLWLTQNPPNIWFYVFVPLVDVLSTALTIFLAARLFKQPLTFLQTLAVTMLVTIFMQIMENVLKITYYKIWAYPGILFMVINFGVYFFLETYILSKWTRLRWPMALLLAAIGIIGSMIISGIFLNLTGLDTPGS